MAAEKAQPSGLAAEPHPALYFRPVSDRDVTVELEVVADAPPAAAGAEGRTRGAKRQRGTAAAAAAPHIIAFQAASQLLKSASPKFCAALERWSGEGERKLRMQCSDEQEAETWSQLLDCIHSLGQQLPADLEAVLRLLLLAREQAAEPVVAACLRELSSKVDQLPVAACLALLSHLETGVSEHEQLQALGSSLLAASCARLLKLLNEDAAVQADADVQAQLLAFLGPLQHMLNDTRRRELYLGLPFELLRDCIFDDCNVNADLEVTVLAAFACWAKRDIQARNEENTQRITTICSRIRFPAISASTLQNYWRFWSFLNHFDPTGDVLARALVAAGEPEQVEMWAELVDEDQDRDEGEEAFTLAQFRAKCGSWWHARKPQLASVGGAAEFTVEIGQGPGPADFATYYSERKYWGGYWWRIQVSREQESCTGIFLMPSTSSLGGTTDLNKPRALTYGIQAYYGICVDGSGASWRTERTDWFLPNRGSGWGNDIKHGGQPVAWDDFWAPGSPWLVDGKACVRFTLEAA